MPDKRFSELINIAIKREEQAYGWKEISGTTKTTYTYCR